MGRLVGMAKGLFTKVSPYIAKAVNYAQPHLKTMATRAVESSIDTAVDKINEKLSQQGKGIKGRRKRRHDKIPNRL